MTCASRWAPYHRRGRAYLLPPTSPDYAEDAFFIALAPACGRRGAATGVSGAFAPGHAGRSCMRVTASFLLLVPSQRRDKTLCALRYRPVLRLTAGAPAGMRARSVGAPHCCLRILAPFSGCFLAT